MSNTVLAAAIVGVALVAGTAAQSTPEGRTLDSLERSFVSSGRIKMDLSAGDYTITGAPTEKIRIEWKVRYADQLPRVKVRADVRGADATISTESPDNSQFKVVVQVPQQADLYLRLTAGDLRVESIRGNKDIEVHAGDVDIDVGRPEDYKHVDAALWAGDLTATPFHVTKGGLFRSFDWNGNGPYRLHAHLKAGDLRLFSKSAGQ
jgi:hypothetical protein